MILRALRNVTLAELIAATLLLPVGVVIAAVGFNPSRGGLQVIGLALTLGAYQVVKRH